MLKEFQIQVQISLGRKSRHGHSGVSSLGHLESSGLAGSRSTNRGTNTSYCQATPTQGAVVGFGLDKGKDLILEIGTFFWVMTIMTFMTVLSWTCTVQKACSESTCSESGLGSDPSGGSLASTWKPHQSLEPWVAFYIITSSFKTLFKFLLHIIPHLHQLDGLRRFLQ